MDDVTMRDSMMVDSKMDDFEMHAHEELYVKGVAAETVASQKQTKDDTTRNYPLRSGRIVTKPKETFEMTKAERRAKRMTERRQNLDKPHGNGGITRKDKKHRHRSAPWYDSCPVPDSNIPFPKFPKGSHPSQRCQPFLKLAISPEKLVHVLSNPMPGFHEAAWPSDSKELSDDCLAGLIGDLIRSIREGPDGHSSFALGCENQHNKVEPCLKCIDGAVKIYLSNTLKALCYPRNFFKIPGETERDMWTRAASSLARIGKDSWLQYQNKNTVKTMIVGKLQAQGVQLKYMDLRRMKAVIQETIWEPNRFRKSFQYLQAFQEQYGPRGAEPTTLMMLTNHFVERRQKYLATINPSTPIHHQAIVLQTDEKKVPASREFEPTASAFSYRNMETCEDSDEEDAGRGAHNADVEDKGQVQGEIVDRLVDQWLIHDIDHFIEWMSGEKVARNAIDANAGILADLMIGDSARAGPFNSPN